MRQISYIQVPTSQADDINACKWYQNKCTQLDEGTHITLYIDHQTSNNCNEEGEECDVTYAMPIRVAKPLTRAKAIAAAEMSAYDLLTASDVASLAASMSRKYRQNNNDLEVAEHDQFISWIKQKLNDIGITSNY